MAAGVAANTAIHQYDIWIGAFRVQREFGKENTAGLLVTDQEFRGSPRHARSYSADARWGVGDDWSLAGQLIRSDTREHEGPRQGDWGLWSRASYDARHLQYRGTYRHFGPNFDTPLGFVSRVGYRRLDQDVEYTFRPAGKLVTRYGPSLAVQWLWDYSSAVLLDREVEAQYRVELKGNTDFRYTRLNAFELFEGLEFRPHLDQFEVGTEWFNWLGFDTYYG